MTAHRQGQSYRSFFLAAMLFAGLGAVAVVKADVEVDSTTRITFVFSQGGGWAKVTSTHLTTLLSYDPFPNGKDHLAMRARMFVGNATTVQTDFVEVNDLNNSTGSLIGALERQGACGLIEGVYTARTDAGVSSLGLFTPGHLSFSGQLFLNCPIVELPCDEPIGLTTTTALDLSGGLVAKRALELDFPLSRVEARGDDTLILDEWAVVEDGRVAVASSPGFARAVAEQAPLAEMGPTLVIQEPQHVMNERHIQKPRARLLEAGLPLARRGSGQIVAARLEVSPQARADRVEILSTSGAVDAEWLETLLAQRVGLVYASEKTHRTSAYVVVRLGEKLELLATWTALPQCCCGTEFCL